MPASYEGAVEWVRRKACEIRGDKPRGVWTEKGRRLVLIGIATASESCVIEVPVEDYKGLVLLELLTGGES